MSTKCKSKLSNIFVWIMEAPLLNIPIFIICMFFIWELLSQQDRYYFFVPIGKYAQYIEYSMLLIVGYFILKTYKNRNEKIDRCNYLSYIVLKIPFGKLILETLFFLLFGYLYYYMVLLYIHKFDIPTQQKSIEVQILDISNRGRKHCKPIASTDLFKKYNPKNKTLFYRFVKEYSFDGICMHNKYFNEGQTVILGIKESSFGMYITDIHAKVY